MSGKAVSNLQGEKSPRNTIFELIKSQRLISFLVPFTIISIVKLKINFSPP